MEVIRLSGMTIVDSPGFSGIEESSKHHCIVDLQLGGKAESYCPQTFSQSLLKAVLALAILFLTSVSMFTTRESVLPR